MTILFIAVISQHYSKYRLIIAFSTECVSEFMPKLFFMPKFNLSFEQFCIVISQFTFEKFKICDIQKYIFAKSYLFCITLEFSVTQSTIFMKNI